MASHDEIAALQRALIKQLINSGVLEETELRHELANIRRGMGLSDEIDALDFLSEDQALKEPGHSFIPKPVSDKPIKVLIVDNVPLIRNLIKNALKPRGNYIFIEGENGIECINLFKIEKPDLILMDIEMEKMNGLDALKEIRSMNKQTPVIMMTGNPTQDYVSIAATYGMTDFISKPLDVERIITVINKFAIQ